MQSLTAFHSFTQASVQYPLSCQQQGLWFLYQLDPNSTAYHLYHTIRIEGALEVQRWEQAWNQVFQAHAILRSRYGESNGQPFRIVQFERIPLRYVQAENWSESTLKAQIVAETATLFRLEKESAIRVSLFQRSEQEFIQVITLHHIAGDMWTFDLLIQNWAKCYQGKAIEVRTTYADYVNWQDELLQCDRGKELCDFWHDQLAGEIPVLALPSQSSSQQKSETQAFLLPSHLIEPLKSKEYSLYRVLLTAFLVLLYRYTSENDLAIGTAMAGRWGTDAFQDVIGYFSNMVPLRVPMQGELEFGRLLEQVDQIVREVQAHQDLPLQELVKQKKTSQLFSATFTWQKHRWITESFGELTLEPYLLEHQGGATFDLDLQVVEAGDRFNLVWQYNVDRFDAEMITRMAQQFETLLENVIHQPQEPISHLPILPAAQQNQLLVEWNDTAKSIPSNCVHELISAQAARTPTAIAVQFDQEQLTYQELEQRSNQLARFLQSKGVQPDDLVGICMARSIDFIVGIFGILKAGGAFVPLDPTYPKERLELLMSDAQVKVLLSDLDEIASFSTAPVQSNVKNNNLAYVIYTSGSTGKPKGVMIEHQSMVNHNLAVIREYELQPSDRVLQASALSFDIAIEEIFPTLICGATLILRSPDCLTSTQQFLQFVEAHQITVLNLPTALWHQIVYGLTELDLVLPPAVRLVVVGGEKASRSTYLTWFERVGNHPRWINTYGPTEATVIATVYDPIRSGFDQGELSIGSAIDNVQTYVLDAQMQPVPIGVAGELYIGGLGVARGYLRRPEQTQAKFIEHQFPDLPPQRLYRTGDLVRYRQDGKLEYLGRNDDQVKIRGFRIELGEIEFALNQHAAVKDSIVLAQSQRLIAYIVAQDAVEPEKLQRFLKQSLPSYMVPSAIVKLTAFPLTANGKVDRKALLEITPATSTRTISRPQTPLEHQLVQIWQEVLKVEPIGVEDDFFELGGHSLLMLQLAAKMEQALGKPIPMAMLYQVPTIQQLSQVLEDEQADFSSALIQFQAGDSTRSPLFCIPGATGTFRFCEGLRAHLDPAQPIYGIQELSIDSKTTLEMMASHAVREMRQFQPKEPYYLMGYSMGAAVAYEIAQQLHAQGQEVALLALIAPGNLMAIPEQLTVLQKLPVVRNFHLLLELLTRWNAFGVESRSMKLRDRAVLFLKKVIWSFKLIVRMILFGAIDHFRGNTDPYWRHGRIVRRYFPRKSAFPVQLFICEEEARPSEMWVSWRTLVENQLTVHILPGTHLSCVDKPSIKCLVEKINPLLPNSNSTLVR
ncbi:amino acid adenylation domain-containing protein [Pseudanabaenaceae cyanobacterium LEGE 13415]|nr:amino acid adenylation domain-containing protein [Pseudanabaenaceae cyanobacterium LEGE 13415]